MKFFALFFLVLASNALPLTSPPDLDNYCVICDAGSSGTRVYVYSWTRKTNFDLIDIQLVTRNNTPGVLKVTPGLSTFGEDPKHAPAYIKQLLDFAERYVPVAKQPFTPLYIFATAGMRLLPQDQQNSILNELQVELPLMTNLSIVDDNIKIIDGKSEGIFNWISLNYILGNFNRSTDGSRPKTVGMTEMGGASVQVAYELPKNNTFLTQDVSAINLAFNSSDDYYNYTLFATTFLGYGANEGYKQYVESLKEWLRPGEEFRFITDNCYPKHLREYLNWENPSEKKPKKGLMRTGSGDWDKCLHSAERLLRNMNNPKTCKIFHPVCYLGYVPAPNGTLSNVELYGFSEYYYSTHVILGLGGAYDPKTIAKRSREFCGTEWNDIKAAAATNLWPGVDEDRLKQQCFKAAWVTTILHDGLNIDKKHNKFQTAKTVDGQDVQWALGAMIYELRNWPV